MPVNEQILLDIIARDNTSSTLASADRGLQNLTGNARKLEQALQSQQAIAGQAERAYDQLQHAMKALDIAQQGSTVSSLKDADAKRLLSSLTKDVTDSTRLYESAVNSLSRAQSQAAAAEAALGLAAQRTADQVAAAAEKEALANERVARSRSSSSGGGGGNSIFGTLYSPEGLAVGGTALAAGAAANSFLQQDQNQRLTVSTTSVDPSFLPILKQVEQRIFEEKGQTFNITQIDAAARQIASAGGQFQNAATLQKVVDAALQYAEGQGVDPATAGHNVAAALSAQRVNPGTFAQQVADILVQTTASAIAPPQDVANAIGTFGGRAFGIGLNLAEPTAAFATLTQGGISSQQSAQDINALLGSLIHPTTTQRTAFGLAGIEDPLKYLQENGLSGLLGRVNSVAGGDPKALQALFSNQAAVEAALGLTGANFGAFQTNAGLNASASGVSARAAGIVGAGPEAQLTTAYNQLKDDATQAGEALVKQFLPAVLAAAGGLHTGFQKAGDLFGFIGHAADVEGAALNLPKRLSDLGNAVGDAVNAIIHHTDDLTGKKTPSPYPVLPGGKAGPVLPPHAETTTNDPSVTFRSFFAPPIGPHIAGPGEPGFIGPLPPSHVADTVAAAARNFFAAALAPLPGTPGFIGPPIPDTSGIPADRISGHRGAAQAAIQAQTQAAADAQTRAALDDLANRSTGRGGKHAPEQLDLIAKLNDDILNASPLQQLQADANAIKASYDAEKNLSAIQKKELEDQVQHQVNAVAAQRAATAAQEASKVASQRQQRAAEEAALGVTQATLAFNAASQGGNLGAQLKASAALTNKLIEQATIADAGSIPKLIGDTSTIIADQANRDAGLRKADADKRAAILAQQLAEQAQLQLIQTQISLAAAERGTNLHAQLAALANLTNLQLAQAAKADKGDPGKLKVDDLLITSGAADQARVLRQQDQARTTQRLAEQQQLQVTQAQLTLAAAERGTNLHAQLADLTKLTNLQLAQAAQADKGDPTKLKLDDLRIHASAADQARQLRLTADQKEMQNLQDRLTLANLQGKGIATAQQAILDDMKAHPDQFTATQIAITAAQFKQAAVAAAQVPVAPFTANQPGLGQLAEAPGQTAVRFGGQSAEQSENARLRAENADLRNQIAALDRIANASERTARAVEKQPGKPPGGRKG